MVYRKDKYEFVHKVSLLDREAYDFYRKNRTSVAKGINDFNLYKKAVSGLCLVIRDMMYQSVGGVSIDYFGYLCFVMTEKRVRNRKVKSVRLRLNKIPRYQLWFFQEETVEKTINFIPWLNETTTTPKKMHLSAVKYKRKIKRQLVKNSQT